MSSRAFVAVYALLLASPTAAAVSEVQAYVLGVTGDRVSVDMGTAQGLKPGDIGVLKRRGERLASLEVVTVDRSNAFLRVVDDGRGFAPIEGDSVFFSLSPSPPEAKAGAGLGGEDEFVPLLAPPPTAKKKAVSTMSTRLRGRLRYWQFYQAVDPISAYYRISRLDTDGAVDRIAGSPWSFVWSGNAGYRDGNRPSSADDFRRVRPHPQRLMATRPLADKGFVRAGRFFPNELPGLGTVDGAALQLPASRLKIGVVAGARPDRRYQEFSSREILASLYASLEAGAPGKAYYAATAGVMHTRWLGKADELALLIDQRAEFGALLGLYGSAQFDFDAGSAVVHKGTRLTRLDFSANSSPTDWLSLRAGLNHFEPVDVAAERALSDTDPALYIDNGYWRYWTGAAQTLPWGLGFDEEVSWTRTADRFQPGLWRATLSRLGLPFVPNGRVYATGYNLFGIEGSDYGAATGLSAPFFDGKFTVDASAGFRYDRGDEARRRWRAGDASLRLDWRPNRTWALDASASRFWQGAVHSTSASGGVSYRW